MARKSPPSDLSANNLLPPSYYTSAGGNSMLSNAKTGGKGKPFGWTIDSPKYTCMHSLCLPYPLWGFSAHPLACLVLRLHYPLRGLVHIPEGFDVVTSKLMRLHSVQAQPRRGVRAPERYMTKGSKEINWIQNNAGQNYKKASNKILPNYETFLFFCLNYSIKDLQFVLKFSKINLYLNQNTKKIDLNSKKRRFFNNLINIQKLFLLFTFYWVKNYEFNQKFEIQTLEVKLDINKVEPKKVKPSKILEIFSNIFKRLFSKENNVGQKICKPNLKMRQKLCLIEIIKYIFFLNFYNKKQQVFLFKVKKFLISDLIFRNQILFNIVKIFQNSFKSAFVENKFPVFYSIFKKTLFFLKIKVFILNITCYFIVFFDWFVGHKKRNCIKQNCFKNFFLIKNFIEKQMVTSIPNMQTSFFWNKFYIFTKFYEKLKTILVNKNLTIKKHFKWNYIPCASLALPKGVAQAQASKCLRYPTGVSKHLKGVRAAQPKSVLKPPKRDNRGMYLPRGESVHIPSGEAQLPPKGVRLCATPNPLTPLWGSVITCACTSAHALPLPPLGSRKRRQITEGSNQRASKCSKKEVHAQQKGRKQSRFGCSPIPTILQKGVRYKAEDQIFYSKFFFRYLILQKLMTILLKSKNSIFHLKFSTYPFPYALPLPLHYFPLPTFGGKGEASGATQKEEACTTCIPLSSSLTPNLLLKAKCNQGVNEGIGSREVADRIQFINQNLSTKPKMKPSKNNVFAKKLETQGKIYNRVADSVQSKKFFYSVNLIHLKTLRKKFVLAQQKKLIISHFFSESYEIEKFFTYWFLTQSFKKTSMSTAILNNEAFMVEIEQNKLTPFFSFNLKFFNKIFEKKLENWVFDCFSLKLVHNFKFVEKFKKNLNQINSHFYLLLLFYNLDWLFQSYGFLYNLGFFTLTSQNCATLAFAKNKGLHHLFLVHSFIFGATTGYTALASSAHALRCIARIAHSATPLGSTSATQRGHCPYSQRGRASAGKQTQAQASKCKNRSLFMETTDLILGQFPTPSSPFLSFSRVGLLLLPNLLWKKNKNFKKDMSYNFQIFYLIKTTFFLTLNQNTILFYKNFLFLKKMYFFICNWFQKCLIINTFNVIFCQNQEKSPTALPSLFRHNDSAISSCLPPLGLPPEGISALPCACTPCTPGVRQAKAGRGSANMRAAQPKGGYRVHCPKGKQAQVQASKGNYPTLEVGQAHGFIEVQRSEKKNRRESATMISNFQSLFKLNFEGFFLILEYYQKNQNLCVDFQVDFSITKIYCFFQIFQKNFLFLIEFKNNPNLNAQIVLLPTYKNLKIHLKNLKFLIQKSNSKTQLQLIKKIASKIIQWCYFYENICNIQVFYYCDIVLLRFLWKWAIRLHPTKSKKWIQKKYFFK